MTTARYVFVLAQIDKRGCINNVLDVCQTFEMAYNRMLSVSNGNIIADVSRNDFSCAEYVCFKKWSYGYIVENFKIFRKYYMEDRSLPIVEHIDYGKEDKKCRLI